MTVTLSVLRERDEAVRFERQRVDDHRTAIDSSTAKTLARALKGKIDGEVRFDTGSRALYATDGSNYRQTPIGVVIPRHEGDVETTVRLASQFGAPILSRGGGTSLAGQCCNVAVLMDFSKYMHHVLDIDATRRLGRVQPGCVLDNLRNTAIKQAGLTFGPDPATHTHCTLGGMLGNNSCGSHSLLSKNNGMGVRTSDNLHELTILTYDGLRLTVGPTPPEQLEHLIRSGGQRGQIYRDLKNLVDKYGDTIRQRFPKLERRVSGYNLNDLLPENGFHIARALVGSESTCITILEAVLHLVPNPKARSVVMLGFDDVYQAADNVLEVLKFNPTALEGIDQLLFDYVKQKGDENANLAILPPGKGFLLVEFGGDSKQDTDGQARRMMDHLKTHAVDGKTPAMKLYDDPEQEHMIWKVREGSLGSTAWVPGHPDTWPGWEDSAVPVPEVPSYLRELRKLFNKYGYNPSLYGHFGQGCIHCRVGFDFYTAQGLEHYRRFMDEATDLIVKYGGSNSGEHGDGQARGQFLPKMFGDEIVQAFHDFKRIWDPQNKMNPGKVINLDGPPYGITDNLRLGPDYHPPQPETHFSFEGDHHSFARAALRCVGVGECRREGAQTMCPSYMVTREEMHSTRGRARMLFEMMNGETITDGWKSEEVKDALDLCLSCKGCKGDCPVNVDMATYKAEFLSHYYEGRLRPRHAYAFGWIHMWATLASVAPSVANLFTQLPGLRSLAKLATGVHYKRKIPPFATQTFKEWFAQHQPKHPAGPPVVLFADTFNNHFHPEVAIAATEVLEDAGFRVHVPMADVCCGRPLYDYGFLGMAKRWWIDLLDKLQPYYRAGIPMVVLEPSCWAAFKDELPDMMPNDEDAKRLKPLTFTLADFLRKKAPHYPIPRFPSKAIVHGHCHQKALDRLNDKEFGKLFAEKEIFKEMGIEHSNPEAGCCGMAGAFGYESVNDHYAVSIACGERVLLPEVRQSPEDQLIIADGFSCQEQIQQETARSALHSAQVLQMAMQHARPPQGRRPEETIVSKRHRATRMGMLKVATLFGAGMLAAVGLTLFVRNHPVRLL
jgi:FAD/FMN-containing dehydrogenase/Fe-S oxidoreductase